MVDFFDKIYSIEDKHSLLRKFRIYSAIRFFTRILANILVPIYFRISNIFIRPCIGVTQTNERQVIVSLTTFPARINKLWIVLESILRQKYKPDMIVLWLSIEQFPSINYLPKSLINLKSRGLEIRFVKDDLRAHKKYFYSIKEFPNDIIITVDDDVIYNSKVLLSLIELNMKYPNAVCSNHATEIIIKDRDISLYSHWEKVSEKKTPNPNLMAIGVGGVLYPPSSLHSDIFNVGILKKYCFLNDDIWLNVMERLKKTNIAKTGYNSNYLPLMYRNNKTLNSQNVLKGLNDEQIRSIRNYYKENHDLDPYQELII